MANQKTMRARCLGGFSIMLVTKCLISLVKIRIFFQKRQKLGPKLAFLFILSQALPAHLVGWLVVVARGLYLARHLFTLFISYYEYFRSSRILFKNCHCFSLVWTNTKFPYLCQIIVFDWKFVAGKKKTQDDRFLLHDIYNVIEGSKVLRLFL